MFRDIRRKDREALPQDALRLLANGEYGILGTAGADRYPYTTPLSYVFVNGKIYFHCALEGHKLDNINYNSNVSFCVVGKTRILPDQFSTVYESAIVFGKAAIIDGEEKVSALKALVDKYSSEYKQEGLEYIKNAAGKTCVVRIDIEQLTAKARRR